MSRIAIAVAAIIAALLSAPPMQALAAEFVWAKQLGGPLQDYAYDVAVDTSGNIYTVGHFQGTADFDPGPDTFSLTPTGSTDAFICKLDSAGNLVWAKQLGGTSGDLAYALKLAVDASGNVYTVGFFNGTVDFDPGPDTFNLTSSGSRDAFVSNLDSAGNIVWAKQLGGLSDEYADGVALDAIGNLYYVGWFHGMVDFDPGLGTFNLTSAGSQDAFVSKLDGAGGLVWAKQLGGPSGDEAHDVAVDASGDVYAIGAFSGTTDFDPGPDTFNLTSAGGDDAFVVKLDSTGNFLWAGQLGGALQAAAFGVAVDVGANIYTVGVFGGTADFDPGPATFNLTSAGDVEVFVSKLDSAGNFLWAGRLGGAQQDYAYDVAVDASGNIYTVGYFQGTTDFDPGPGTFNLTSAGYWDVFISKLDSGGSFVWAKGMGGTLEDVALGVALNPNGNIYTVGIFSGTADFDPGPDTFNLTSAGSTDAFVLNLANSVSNPAGCVPPPSDSVGWWLGEDNALDVLGLNPGDLVNGAAFTDGYVDRAFSFDGVNDYVNVGSDASLFFSNSDAFTVEAWFRPESENSSYFILRNAAYGVRWQGSSSPMDFYNGTDHASSKTSWQIGRWYHVALVDDGINSVKLYIDGVLDKSDDGPLRNPNRFPCHSAGYCFELQFGGYYETHDVEYFKGQVDEVTLYSRALSASEIHDIYLAGASGKCNVEDTDGDGYSPPDDCDDLDPGIHPGASEMCDAQDNDCDGNVDGFTTTCGVGVCASSGSCVDGTDSCLAGQPSPEVCDGLDNDCDGVVDNGDPGGGAMCGATNVGECSYGTTTCQSGGILCVGDVGPVAEVCDGLDNDCDGVADHGNPGGGAMCGTTDVGVCSFGVVICEAGTLACVGNVEPVAEVYDGQDNDCDGQVDDGVAPCGVLSSIVGWWPGEGDAADIAGGNSGTLVNGAGFGTGIVGRAFSFDGTGEVVIPHDASLNLDSLTLEAWVYPTVTDGGIDVILNKEVDSVSSLLEYEIGIRGTDFPGRGTIPVGNLAFYLGGINGLPSEHDGWADGGGAVPLNGWTHVALTFDRSTVVVYIDGQMTRTLDNLSGTLTQSTGSLKIGSRSDIAIARNRRERFTGLIDEPSIYDRALLSSEVHAIFAAGSQGKCQVLDRDGDGFRPPDDCDDRDPAIHPGASEVCDGIDNDCNGDTDDNFGATTCGVGECQKTVQNCVGAVPQTCVPGTPTAEVCNGLDDDCDGTIDEGLGPGTVGVSLDPVRLWPPNHRMVDVHAAVIVSGGCPSACPTPPVVILTSAISNEPDDADGVGDGQTVNDIQEEAVGSASFDFKLRAERDGTANGRLYQVTYMATDCFGDAAVGYGGVFVPHDEGGTTEPLAMDVVPQAGGGAGSYALEWNPIDGATAYNVLRGRVSSIRSVGSFTVIEDAECLGRGMTRTEFAGGAFEETPPAGEAFFFLVEYSDGHYRGYGTATGVGDVVITSGDACH